MPLTDLGAVVPCLSVIASLGMQGIMQSYPNIRLPTHIDHWLDKLGLVSLSPLLIRLRVRLSIHKDLLSERYPQYF